MKRKRKTITAAVCLLGILLVADWLYRRDMAAGLSGALLLGYVTGLLAWLLGIFSAFTAWLVALPVISSVNAILSPLLAPVLTPILLILTKIGPFKWAANKVRKVKSIKMKHCHKCGKQMPADGIYCPYCRRKAKHRKNVPHKKRSP